MNPSAHPLHAHAAAAGAAAVRRLGRFELRSLVGKSQRSMVWRAQDLHADRERYLLLPRCQPSGPAALQRWEFAVRRALRLQHPHVAEVCETGVSEQWPYVLYDAAATATLAERLRGAGPGPQEAALLCAQVLRALAYAHDGGIVHRDLQPSMLLLDAQGQAKVMGFEVGWSASDVGSGEAVTRALPQTSLEALDLPALRQAARSDVLAMGLILHWMLSGRPALDEPDVAALLARLPPGGRELVRLPWNTPAPVPEALRAMVNRATDRQPRQRYRSARGMERAVEGWLRCEGSHGQGPLALLMDRLHSGGTLPSAPGNAERVARLARMERERTNELAEVVLQDLGLAFELLRVVNGAQRSVALAAGSGPVLTLRRAIAMLGLDGVGRAALALRPWPGPLANAAARRLDDLIVTAKRAGRLAQTLRPSGYDAEVVYLVTLLQNLGRLLAAYHLPDELQQIRRLMRPASVRHPGGAEDAGLSEQAASYAVLGADLDGIGAAVARHWGLDDAALRLIRRLPLTTSPRSIDRDDEVVRAVASCAIEAIDACAHPQAQRERALQSVVQRYGRALDFKLEDLLEAIGASDALGRVSPPDAVEDALDTDMQAQDSLV